MTQDAIAALILAELESQQRWDESFAHSQDALAVLAEEALAEHRAGRSEPLDPDACPLVGRRCLSQSPL